ncbi:MAG: hypothetical protein KIT27_11155 [Legionellales bacterium]|nr:hypothetical protein [Legionellales bacterium]
MTTETELQPKLTHRLKAEFNTLIKVIFCVEPILVNIFAIIFCVGVLFLLNQPELMPNMGHYHQYLIIGVKFLLALQIIRSSSKSLILPLSAILIAIAGITLHLNYSMHFPVSVNELKELLVVGILGVCVCCFYLR